MDLSGEIKRFMQHTEQSVLFNTCAKYLSEVLSVSLWAYGIDKIDISVSKKNDEYFIIGVRLKRGLDVTLAIMPADYVFIDNKMVELCDLIKTAIDKKLEKESKAMPLEVN